MANIQLRGLNSCSHQQSLQAGYFHKYLEINGTSGMTEI